MYKSMSFNVWRDIYEINLPKRLHHIQLGLDREISDEEEEEIEEEEETQYIYETEEDILIDEFDKDYIEHLDLAEAARADPFVEEGGEPSGVGKGGRVAGHNHYDQLKQEDEILGNGSK